VDGNGRTPLEIDGCAIDVPWRLISISLGLSPTDAAELEVRAERAGLSVDEAVTAIVTSVLRS